MTAAAVSALLTGLSAFQSDAAQTLNQFLNVGRNKTGYIESQATAPGGETYTIAGGGNDIWDRADEFSFAYHEFVGDFDIRVQVSQFDASTANLSCCPKAGIMVRESLAEDSRRVMQAVSPANKANSTEFLWRTGINNESGENGGTHSVSPGAPPFPDAWIRVTREGSKFTGYRSMDGGVTWQQIQQVDTATWAATAATGEPLGGPLPRRLYVGLGVCRHGGNGSTPELTARAVFTNYTERYFNADQKFSVAGADSKGCPNRIYVSFNRPVGESALDYNNYSLYGGGGQLVNAVIPGPDSQTVVLDVETLEEGATYSVVVANVTDTDGNALTDAGADFIHGKGFEARKIHIQHNKIDGGGTGYFQETEAYRLGIGADSDGYPGMQSGSLFEDTIPTGDSNERYSTRIFGVLNVPADGNYKFATANDDEGRLFISPDDNAANKQQILVNGCCQPYRGFTNSASMTPLPLNAGQGYYLEYIYSEGGGGNYGSVAWDAGAGNIIQDQMPMDESLFVPSRFAFGTLFYNLGAPMILAQPQPAANVPLNQSATFSVRMDGTPPYTFQWFTNGVAVPGANAPSFTINGVQAEMTDMQVKVIVGNGCGEVESETVPLTVKLNPQVLSVTSKGNCHGVYVQWNVPMNLDGEYTLRSDSGALTIASKSFASTTQKEILLSLAQGSTLTDGTTYTLSVTGVHASSDLLQDPDPTGVQFTHGSEYMPFRILWQKWDGLGTRTIDAFLADPGYARPASERRDLPGFETAFSQDYADNYGGQISGYWNVPATGTYYFWVSSDDYGATYIATDANPAHKVLINREPEWANYRAYTTARDAAGGLNATRGTPPANGSAGIQLTQGQLVYLQGNFTEGGGGDHFAATWVMDNSTPPADGSATALVAEQFRPSKIDANGCVFTTLCDAFVAVPPADQSVFVGQTASFTVTADGTPASATCYYYQWYKNGLAIPGAIGSLYQTPPATADDDGALYTVAVSNDFSGVVSVPAHLSVRANPILLDATTLNDPNHIYLTWNKPVNFDTALFELSGGIIVNYATYGDTQDRVVLSTEDIPADAAVTLTISGVTDLSGVAPQEPDPINVGITQGPSFGLCTDFSSLPANATVNDAARVADGVLHLTDAVNSTQGSFIVDMARPVPSFVATFKALIGDSTTGQADGMSFCYGTDITGSFGESGSGTGLIVVFNTYAGYFRGARLVWGGTEVARAPYEVASTPAYWRDVYVAMSEDGKVTLSYEGKLLFDAVQIPGLKPITGNIKFGLGGRCGGENEKNWVDDLCINNFALGTAGAAISQASVQANECSTVTLTATPSGSPPYRFEWKKNGKVIPGATGPTYTTPPLKCATDQGAVFTAVVYNLFSSGESASTVNITCDTTAPVLVSAGSLDGTALGLRFSEKVDAATATDPANYVLDSGAPGDNIAGIRLLPSGKEVVIGLSNRLTAPFTITETAVLDDCPAVNSSSSTVQGLIENLKSTDIGERIGSLSSDPKPPGTNYVFGAQDIQITTGGSDTWGNSDHQHFVYTERCGDFDMKVKVVRLDAVTGWTKGGLAAKAALTNDSALVMTHHSQWANQIESGARYGAGQGIFDFAGGFPRPSGAGLLQSTPWLRIARQGDQLMMYSSTNGLDWQTNGNTGTAFCGQLPQTMFIGMYASPNCGNDGRTTTAEFTDFTVSPQGPCGQLTACGPLVITNNGGAISITWPEGCCRLQGTTELNSDPAATTWTDVTGATSPYPVTPDVPFRFFRTVRP